MKFIKRTIVIEAMRYNDVDGIDELLAWMYKNGGDPTWENDGRFTIHTLEGEMTASKGDWIIKGVKGEFYPCKPDIFEETYDRIEE